MTPQRPVLVLGAGGRVGRLLRGAWALDPALPDAVFQSRHAGPGIDLVFDPASYAEADFLAAVTSIAPDMVVALWGVTPHSGTTGLDDNTRLALLALDAGRRSGARRVVLISTAAVYTPSDRAHCETDALAPVSAYGQAKWRMEQAAADWCQMQPDAPAVTILRLANVAGADFLGDVVRQTSEGSALRLDRFADGHGPRRSYLSPRTLAFGLGLMSGTPASAGCDVFNMADGHSAWDMAGILAALDNEGRAVDWSWTPAPSNALAVHRLNPDRLMGAWPALAERFCQSPDELVADWLAAGGGAP